MPVEVSKGYSVWATQGRRPPGPCEKVARENTDARRKQLNEYIVELYKVLDNELADAYGIDPGTTPRMVGRHIEPKKIKRRLINPSNGVAASTLLPHTLRLVASKILTFLRLSSRANLSIQQTNEFFALEARLPNIRRPGGTPCDNWLKWEAVLRLGIRKAEPNT